MAMNKAQTDHVKRRLSDIYNLKVKEINEELPDTRLTLKECLEELQNNNFTVNWEKFERISRNWGGLIDCIDFDAQVDNSEARKPRLEALKIEYETLIDRVVMDDIEIVNALQEFSQKKF